jgi:hypothetical protein
VCDAGGIDATADENNAFAVGVTALQQGAMIPVGVAQVGAS